MACGFQVFVTEVFKFVSDFSFFSAFFQTAPPRVRNILRINHPMPRGIHGGLHFPKTGMIQSRHEG
jgi:hypothetical protein